MSRVLIVNDDETVINRTAQMLEDMAWEVYTAASDAEARDVYLVCEPELVIVDIDMHAGVGFEAMATIRRQAKLQHIIAVTRGRHESILGNVAAVCGASCFVEGPVSAAKLRQAIEDWLLEDERAVESGEENNRPGPSIVDLESPKE